jgi:eukaryotic-like serine/threonine-protein kinase
VEREGPPETPSQGGALGETWSYGAVPPVRLGTPAGELAFGSTVDRYVVLDRVGEGGMGVVYAAYDPKLDRKVALKFLNRPDPQHGEWNRLLREAQAMARLAHPNVAVAYDVGTSHGHVFLAMELVDGVDLRTWLQTRKRTVPEILAVFSAAGQGLAAAHASGIVHRDFKPANVLVDKSGRSRVTDFGLSRSIYLGDVASPADGEDGADGTPDSIRTPLNARFTFTGAVLGTPSFMSPEQHDGKEADARSDQFSFCVALYEALHGVRPFAGETLAELRESILARRLAPTSSHVPAWLNAAVLRGLSASPADRWPSMEALLTALAGDPARARRQRWLRRTAALVALAGVSGAFFVLRGQDDEGAVCTGAADKVAQVWSPATRQKVRAAFLATKDPNATDMFGRVERALDRRLATWADAHTEACRATRVRGEQSEPMLDLRMQCLERARRQMQNLVWLWQDKVQLSHAAQAALSVGDVTGCSDTVGLASPIAPARESDVPRVNRIRAKLDEIEARQRAGQYKEALSLIPGVVASARQLGYAPVLAEALHTNGRLETEVGQNDRSIALIQEALKTASGARDDVLAAKAMRDLLFITGVRARRFAEANGLWSAAEAVVARAGNRDDLVTNLLAVQGALRTQEGHPKDAAALLERALALGEKTQGPEQMPVVRILTSLAIAKSALGEWREVEQLDLRALAFWEDAVGPLHPYTSTAVQNLCAHSAEQREVGKAAGYCARSLEIIEQVYPSGHPEMGGALANLGIVRSLQERNEEAGELLDRAAQILVRALGPDDPALVIVRTPQAELALKLDDIAQARRILNELLPAAIKAYGEDHPYVAEVLTIHGDLLVHESRLDEARAAHERAMAIGKKVRDDHPSVGRSLQGLATVALAGRRYAQAIEQFERALELLNKGYGPASAFVVAAQTGLGEAFLGAGQTSAAVAVLQQAVSTIETHPVHLGEGKARLQLARALWASGQRTEGVAMARKARQAFVRGSMTRAVDKVDRWLREHPAG